MSINRQTACHTNSKMGFGSIKKQVGLTHLYQVNELGSWISITLFIENDSYQIGSVIFNVDDHNCILFVLYWIIVCYKSYTNGKWSDDYWFVEILVGVGSFVGLCIIIGFLVFLHRKKKKSLVRRLSTSNRKDLGGFDNTEADNAAAF